MKKRQTNKREDMKEKVRLKIKVTMKTRGLSQRSFAKRTGLPHSYVSEVLSGNKPINVKMAVALEFMCIGTAKYWISCEIDHVIKLEKLNWKF